VGWKDTDAVSDFKRRIENHIPYYTTITDLTQSFVKLINVGEKIIVNNVQGFLQSKIVYYLMHLHISPRKIYFAKVNAVHPSASAASRRFRVVWMLHCDTACS